jgi:hypothetical protein
MKVLSVIDQNTDMPAKRRHIKGEKPSAGESPIVHVSLEGLLPKGEILAVNREHGFVSILTFDGQNPRIRAEQYFTPVEMSMLLPLVSSYPAYCPNELLLASFSGGTTEKDIERARNRLLRVKERGEWDALLRPLRNALSRVRIKLNKLGIDVRSIFETGYTLIPYTEGQYRRLRRPEKQEDQ